MNCFVKKFPLLLTAFMACVWLASSCKKNDFITAPSAKLSTSLDTLRFDTVFASTGSITQSFTVRNENDQALLLNHIRLMGGGSSPYRININGLPSPNAENITLAANDSLYLFVTVTINPTTANLPFIVRDSIEIAYNGNNRYVQLEAFGQNARFLRNEVIRGNVVWNNQLPYVILDRLQIDTTATLTLEAGCKVYSQAAAPILVNGSLRCNGTRTNPVVFRGARLDEAYKDLPASWPGIYFLTTSQNNQLIHTHIQNAYQAIVAENPASSNNPKLTMQQCIIDNAYDAGILAVNTSLAVNNTLLSNCGSNINLVLGGEYTFTHCTVAAYPAFFQHTYPVLSVGNGALINGNPVSAPINAQFKNCIFWGTGGMVDDEVQIKKQGATPFDVRFNNCLLKNNTLPAAATFINCLQNQDPLFDSIQVSRRYFDFHTNAANAPGINKGIPTPFAEDLDGNTRNVVLPDLGCYEKQ